MAFEAPISDPELSLEEDIVDHLSNHLSSVGIDDEIPARPGSRLGFNGVEDDDTLSTPSLDDEFLEEAHFSETFCIPGTSGTSSVRLFEDEFDISIPVAERDITSKTSATSGSPGPGDVCEVLHESQDISDDEDAESNYSSCDDEGDTTFLYSTDADVNQFLEPRDDSDWSVPPKFSCLPSPLSTRYFSRNASSSYRHTPHRHRYHQHGHSHHALLHLKWFWAAREDMWMEHKARMCEAKAYDGLSIFSSVSPGLRLPGGYFSPDPADTPQPPPPSPMARLPPLTIHPRRGDLSALHDPYCVHIDRYFVGMPLWTMSKTLWMFDMHMASGGLEAQKQQEELENDVFEDASSENESINTLDSNTFSDDSDTTLVDSESEADLPRRVVVDRGAKKEEVTHTDPDASSSSCPKTEEAPSSSSYSKTQYSTPHFRWVTNWYRRWEVLLQLCVENNPKIAGHHPPVASSLPRKSQRFFISDDDWTDVLDDDDDIEDDEEMSAKNVLVVVNDEVSTNLRLRHWI
ncbi:hypothetical protein H0H87_000796 [Tephrocybe sp. NHM501043]|nr:hypothetical protein H0H87_000796 [Tephrocybe sp. NHM501043]